MSHANAALTPKARLRIAKLIVDQQWSVSTAAKMFMVSWPTAKRWADRYRAHGAAGMADKPSRPRTSPARTPQAAVKQIVALRWRKRLGPVQIAYRLGLAASTVHAVLVRCRINRLRYIDRVTGEKIRRYEHPYPGSMIHVDVTKFGNIPDGGGHRFVGRQAGDKNR
ncbi:helix-turn-helix domain-containing protein, partial [Arthrobacter rhombi]